MRGPVVAQLGEVFADDWQFATGEALRGAPWFVPLAAAGDVLARCIDDGPDESSERLRWAIVGGLNAAQRSVRVLTPYFVPDGALITALDVAAMRGVEVDIVFPRAATCRTCTGRPGGSSGRCSSGFAPAAAPS